jgi:hypothetical protein
MPFDAIDLAFPESTPSPLNRGVDNESTIQKVLASGHRLTASRENELVSQALVDVFGDFLPSFVQRDDTQLKHGRHREDLNNRPQPTEEQKKAINRTNHLFPPPFPFCQYRLNSVG